MILITGGAGFIGSNLLAGFAAVGQTNIVIADRMGLGEKWRNISKYEVRDLIHPDSLFQYLETHGADVEMVFHLGGISSTTESDVDLLTSQNINFSRRLWDWCARYEKRFVYASSGATYGNGDHGFKDDDSFEALSALRPTSPYGWSKHAFDRMAVRLARSGGPVPPQWVGLKFFNVYGPNEYHKGDNRSVPSKLCPQVASNAAVKLFKSNTPTLKNGEQQRDFIYVRDCVAVMLWLYATSNVSGLYNLGSGQARTFNALAEAIFKAHQKPPKIQYIDMDPEHAARYQNFTQADMTKLRAAGYVKAFLTLEQGIEDYVQNYLMKEDRYA